MSSEGIPVSTHPVLVTGATGSVGRHVVDGLLAAGRPVRALTRRPGAAGVGHVVLLSSLSVDYAEPDASSRAHLACEVAVLAAGIPHTFLRPGAFMGNDLIWVPEVQSFGTVSAAYPEAAHASVDERDIVAVAALCRPERFAGAVPITGPESLTQRRRVERFAEVTGEPVGFVEFTPEQARTRMAGTCRRPLSTCCSVCSPPRLQRCRPRPRARTCSAGRRTATSTGRLGIASGSPARHRSAQVELRDRVGGVRVRLDREPADHLIAVRFVRHFVVETRHEHPQFLGAHAQLVGQLADLDHQDLLSRLYCRGTACSLSSSG
jgi:NAD dependent epimerase/dehydratase family